MNLAIKTQDEYDRACKYLDQVWRREKDLAGISLTAVPFVEPISPKQRGKLFAMLDDLGMASGNAPYYLRAYFEQRYGPSVGGRSGPLPKPMSAYSKEEASAMIERVYQIAAEKGYQLR